MMHIKTPIVIIGFNRPGNIAKLRESIGNISFQKIYFLVDGPRTAEIQDKPLVDATIEEMNKISNIKERVFITSNENLGCKKRVLSGLSQIFSMEEEVIVLEDDCIPAPSFFTFCEYALNKYRHDNRIALISGSNLMSHLVSIDESHGLSMYINCWGWAGWKKTWEVLDQNLYLADIKNQIRNSTNFNSLPMARKKYWIEIFKLSVASKTIWDFYLQHAFFKNNLYAIFPKNNYIKNIGFNNDATHTKLNIPSYVIKNPSVNSFEVKKFEKTSIEYNKKLKYRDSLVDKTIYGFSLYSLSKIILGNFIRFIFKY